jgi:hypothetical protein
MGCADTMPVPPATRQVRMDDNRLVSKATHTTAIHPNNSRLLRLPSEIFIRNYKVVLDLNTILDFVEPY